MLSNTDLDAIKSSFDFVEVVNADADFTAIKLLEEPFSSMIIKFNTVKLSEILVDDAPEPKLHIDYSYSVIRTHLTTEDLETLKEQLENYLSKVLTYTLLWANDNDKMHLIPFKE